MKVHVGRGLCVSSADYAYAFGQESSENFVRCLAKSLIGKDTLKKATITGNASRRSINKDENTRNMEKMDARKVTAISGT